MTPANGEDLPQGESVQDDSKDASKSSSNGAGPTRKTPVPVGADRAEDHPDEPEEPPDEHAQALDVVSPRRQWPSAWSRRARSETPAVAEGIETQPGYVSPGRSALLHWRSVIVIAIITTVIGVGYGFVKSPLYSAESILFVGKTISPSNPNAVAGLPSAAATIAGDYARLISTASVATDAAKRMGHTGHLGGTISATQIPNTPEIRVDATAANQTTALKLANAAALAMIDAVNTINQTSQNQLNQLQSQYASLLASVSVLQNQIKTGQAQLQTLTNSGQGNSAQATQLINQISNWSSQMASQNLQATSIQTQYENDYTPSQTNSQAITLVGPPASRGSNRRTTLEIGALAGIFGGLIIGTAAASLRDLKKDRLRKATTA